MSNADKLKKFTLARKTEIRRLDEIYLVAQNATSQPSDLNLNLVFKTMCQNIDSIQTDFFKYHNSIIGLLSDSDDAFDIEDDIRKKFEKTFYSIKANLLCLESSTITTQSNASSSENAVALPHINLPFFSGDISEFPTFLDLFNALIHNNDKLSDIQKFKYLQLSVKGSALTSIKRFQMTQNNYQSAYDALVKKFKRTRLIAESHWSAIEDFPKITSENPTEIHKLLDAFGDNLEALKNLNLPVNQWDFCLVQMILKRIPTNLAAKFELHHGSSSDPDEFPTFTEVTNFLTQHCNAFDHVNFSRKLKYKSEPRKLEYQSQQPSRSASSFFVTNDNGCIICKLNHTIYKCPEFLNKNSSDRYKVSKTLNLCINCLSNSHNFKNCKSTTTCHKCKQRHHTLLHFDKPNQPLPHLASEGSGTSNVVACSSSQSPLHSLQTSVASYNSKVLLSTALVEVLDSNGSHQVLRCLLDSGSMTSFITLKAVRRLGLKPLPASVQLNGLGSMQSSSNGALALSIRSVNKPHRSFLIDTIVLPRICDDMPVSQISPADWSHLTNLKLADPQFNSPGAIDLLLGADIFPQILLDGQIKGFNGAPDAINTVFGYVLMGKIVSKQSSSLTSLFCNMDDMTTLNESLKRFWEIESVPQVTSNSPEDILCEKIFSDECSRLASGRFVVPLLFKENLPSFDGIRDLAIHRFYSLEKRLLKRPDLYVKYCSFMKEYLELGHMNVVTESTPSPNSYYIPHHCVLKPESTTTSLRVVFNASAKLPNQPSLNDCLFCGPKLQQDIVTILLNFRLHPFVFTADIKMMYRQILVASKYQDYQRIIWRFSPHEPIQEYRLKTVTYGVTSAPFLAIRTLLELAEREGSSFPLASEALRTATYVDDIVVGASSFEAAESLQGDLIELLRRGGFELRKWSSNDDRLLSHIPESCLAQKPHAFDEHSPLKVLGLQWNPSSDTFHFTIPTHISKSCTKRILLSNLAKIFDPLGIISPVTFLIKHLIQRLWSCKLTWDESPPSDILRLWDRYVKDFPSLQNLSLSRRLSISAFSRCELHGFGDASEKGYCAVIYLVFENLSGHRQSFFVSSKSKIAPLKTLSLPRLELCASVLVAKLAYFIYEQFNKQISIDLVRCWSDSTVVLSWIRSSPHRWKTFVSNRVAYIQGKFPASSWSYVPTSENPADLGSRGILPSELLHNSLWWIGPSFLLSSIFSSDRPEEPLSSEVLNEARTITLQATISPNIFDELLAKYSSITRINRILFLILRFIHNIRNPQNKHSGSGSASDLYQALLQLVKHEQKRFFHSEISLIQEGKLLPKNFRKLSPFFDDLGILRVGGRLANAPLPFDTRFPALLPSNSRLTTLLIEDCHITQLHAGIQTVQFLLIQRFWILNAKKIIRKVISKCVRCWKVNPSPYQPPMGNLPFSRVSQLKPFSHVGTDIGGPFTITMSKTRGAKTQKAYLCLFLCFATKAVHLELVSDLSADAFLAALRRFIARRGRCSHIYSDCGTNFVSAYRQIKDFLKLAAIKESISWHFNPPSAPHFGGLWESGIKSVKTHLIRIVGDQVLTYEELSTVFIQIEAVLNSRPLTPCSSDPNDLSALSPGVFLTMEPLTAPPEPDLSDVPLNRLSRWQLICRLHQHFWQRWSQEYLHTLHQRKKWLTPSQPVTLGTLVVVKQENTPPLHWPLGRIVETHPGKDGVVRVVTIKTARGTLKRPLVKLCPLPVDN